MSETTVLGMYEEINSAADAVRRLQSEKQIGWRDLMVMSCAPFPEGVLLVDKSPMRLPLTTVVCAFVGIAFGILLAGGTALLYQIPTGGKPIVSGPPTAIIAYEMMMVFALTGVFFRALHEMRLPNWKANVYDERVSEGLIAIAVHLADDTEAESAINILREAGACDIRRDARRF
jgi:hypothetical protein